MILLKQYRSHKTVMAAKLCAITYGVDASAQLYFDEKHTPCLRVNAAYVAKHRPQVGGYYVRYSDGYESWSPAAAFEDGYTLVET